jgi:hypothetical protein
MSCSTDSKTQISAKVFFDGTAYPKQTFSSVALFVLDPSQGIETATDSGTVYDKILCSMSETPDIVLLIQLESRKHRSFKHTSLIHRKS